MSDENEQSGTLKPDACPNPECKRDHPPTTYYDDWDEEWSVLCGACNMRGPGDPDEAIAIRLWNRLPRAAGRGDLL